VVLAASCIGPFDKLRAGSSVRKRRGPQDDRLRGDQSENGSRVGDGNALRGWRSRGRVGGPSTSQTDSKGESVCCAQDDNLAGGVFRGAALRSGLDSRGGCLHMVRGYASGLVLDWRFLRPGKMLSIGRNYTK